MIRILFLVTIGLHGLIHLMGLVKAFNFAEIKELTLNVSKFSGLIWGIAFLLFFVALVQNLTKNGHWWLFALIAVFISQLLIIFYWQDAKFGTIPNILIIIVALLSFAEYGFDRNISTEIERIMSNSVTGNTTVVTGDMLNGLPQPVSNWLLRSGVVGKEKVVTVRLKQKAKMKMKPGQKGWTDAKAEQYFSIREPAFVWKVDLKMFSLFGIKGRDKFIKGKGEMLIKVLSLFPVVNSKNNKKINEGTLQRFLGEIVWFPSAALSSYITWEEVDGLSAKATMTYGRTSGSGIFSFDKNGNFVQFSTMRYKGDGDVPIEWVISVEETGVVNGIKIPVKLKATWKLDEGDWTWLKINITDIEYNKTEEYKE